MDEQRKKLITELEETGSVDSFDHEVICVKAGAVKAAIELLKAQEPRVMTKEEIIGWDGYIWFEYRGMRAMEALLIDHGMLREPGEGDFPTKDLAWENYQKTWRCWTSRPTDEQREKVKWE